MANSKQRRVAFTAAYSILLFPALVFRAGIAEANCVTAGTPAVTTCDATAPNPTTTTIGTGTQDNQTVNVQAGSSVAVGDANAVSLRDNVAVNVLAGGSLTNVAVNGNGNYATGANTVEFRNNGTLTVQQGGQIISKGTQGSAEAVNLQGTGNVITNNGLIQGVRAAAIWFQNPTGGNTVINNATGVIQANGNVIGASGSGSVDFTNRGQVIGNLIFANGNDTLRLFTGSSISGNFDGGGGTNAIFLNGLGASTLPGNFTNFAHAREGGCRYLDALGHGLRSGVRDGAGGHVGADGQ